MNPLSCFGHAAADKIGMGFVMRSCGPNLRP